MLELQEVGVAAVQFYLLAQGFQSFRRLLIGGKSLLIVAQRLVTLANDVEHAQLEVVLAK